MSWARVPVYLNPISNKSNTKAEPEVGFETPVSSSGECFFTDQTWRINRKNENLVEIQLLAIYAWNRLIIQKTLVTL